MLTFNFEFQNYQKFVPLFAETSPALKNSWLRAWTELYENICRGVFTTHSNICDRTSSQKSQEGFIVDFWLGSKYASDIGFTVEKVYRM